VILDMKNAYPAVSLVRLCWLLGVTRQAFYQHHWHQLDLSTEHVLVLEKVRTLREEHPVIGTRKLQVMLQSFMLEHQIKMGRDGLFNLLNTHRMLVRKRRRSLRTTQSNHWFKKYANLIRGWHPSGPMQLWVADITYVPVNNRFLYLSMITDAYSHRIVGYQIAESLEAVHTTEALQMALRNEKITTELIHHSDRGLQYCSYEYVKLLEQNNIRISMTETGDPLENPVAERINGIIKNEYLLHYPIQDSKEALQLLVPTIEKYNNQRPHQSISMFTPNAAHLNPSITNKTWSKIKNQLPCKPISGLP
jgi:putative transposase